MNKKLTKSGKQFFQNTMRMVNFTNRLKEENMMWKKFDKIKKRKLDESDDESDRQSTDLTYENRYFREKDESMNSSSRMDISMHESNNLSGLRHLNESDVKVKKIKTPSKRTPDDRSPKRTPSKRTPSKSAKKKANEEETSDSESSSDDEECMVDSSFNSADERLIKTPKKSRTPLAEKKIKKREKFLKKQLDKLKKKDKKDKKKSKKKKDKKKHKS